jgi:hypothetical protein
MLFCAAPVPFVDRTRQPAHTRARIPKGGAGSASTKEPVVCTFDEEPEHERLTRPGRAIDRMIPLRTVP